MSPTIQRILILLWIGLCVPTYASFEVECGVALADTDSATAVAELPRSRPLTSSILPDHVLGPTPQIDGTNRDLVDPLVRSWASKARIYVAGLKGDSHLRANIYELLMKDITRRSSAWPAFKKSNFQFHRITMDSGVELFIGSVGHFVEIRPDGAVYSGAITVFENAASHPFEPDWIPPYDAQGNPVDLDRKFINRFRVDPHY